MTVAIDNLFDDTVTTADVTAKPKVLFVDMYFMELLFL
jgi:hypothetical protein